MSQTLTPMAIEADLTDRIAAINIAEPLLVNGMLTQAAASVVVSQITGGIIATVTQFLADNADLLPPKEAVLEAVNKAIDAALAKINRPLITALISRTIKTMIANVISAAYDAILNPPTSIEV